MAKQIKPDIDLDDDEFSTEEMEVDDLEDDEIDNDLELEDDEIEIVDEVPTPVKKKAPMKATKKVTKKASKASAKAKSKVSSITKPVSVRIPLSTLETLEEQGVDVAEAIKALCEDMVKSKICPTCGQTVKKHKA